MPPGDRYTALFQTRIYGSESVKTPLTGEIGVLSCQLGIPLVAESGTDHLEKPTWSTLASLFSEEIGRIKLTPCHNLVK